MLTHIDLFTGIGGFSLAAEANGIGTEVMCENDERCREFLRRAWPGVPIVDDVKELVNSCQEFVHIVGSERFLRVTPDVSRVIQRMSENGERNTQTHGGRRTENTTPGESRKSPIITVANVPVAGSIGWSSFAFITNAIMAMRKGSDITTHLSGKSLSSEDIQTIMKCFVTTATTRKRYMEYVHIKRPWLLTAGVPCQPASRAGQQRGAADNRWLWPPTLALIRYFKPSWVLLENPSGIFDLGVNGVPLGVEGGGVVREADTDTYHRIHSRQEDVYLGVAYKQLQEMGYECCPPIEIPACAINSPQRRARYWIVAHRCCKRRQQDSRSAHGDEETHEGRTAQHDHKPAGDGKGDVADGYEAGRQGRDAAQGPDEHGRAGAGGGDRQEHGDANPWSRYVWVSCADGKLRRAPDDSFGVVDGLHRSVLAALGNSIVWRLAAEIIRAMNLTLLPDEPAGGGEDGA